MTWEIFFDVIFFAILAGYIGYRLFRVLGQNEGLETPNPLKNPAAPKQEIIVNEIPKPAFENDEIVKFIDLAKQDEIKEKLAQINASDKDFTLGFFIIGARKAFEMVIEAFNKKDYKTLEFLLSKDLFEFFKKELDEQNAKNESMQKTLVSILESRISKIVIDGKKVIIDVLFMTEQINITKNQQNELISGNASKIERIEDHWRFEREMNSSDPSWAVTAVDL